jgi:AAA15 family ATPase/GTPase
MKVNASVEIDKSCIEYFSLTALEKFFSSHKTEFIGLELVTESKYKLNLRGTKDQLRKAIRSLLYRQSQKQKIKFDIPQKLKVQLDELKNSSLYRKNYDKVAEDYMKYCVLHDEIPHPEVDEGFVY